MLDSHQKARHVVKQTYPCVYVPANLGGIFGLCLGGSLISIIELLWFLIDLLFTTCIPSKKITPQKKFTQKGFAANLSPVKFKSNLGKRKLAFIH